MANRNRDPLAAARPRDIDVSTMLETRRARAAEEAERPAPVLRRARRFNRRGEPIEATAPAADE
jgi:hypothetical protein